MTSSMSDVELASDLAVRAGALLLELQKSSGETGKPLGALGDAESNQLLLDEVAKFRPEDAVLSEEKADSPERLSADRVWIIDPLDGTREYGLTGRADWAVHVALWERSAVTPGAPEGSGAITAAAVSQPALDAVYTSADASLASSARDRLVFLVSESRPPKWAQPVADALDAELLPMGSAGAKAMAVLRGEADAYLHDGGQWEWDSAAPVGVLQGADVHCSRIDGSPLLYNVAHPYLPDLLLCRPELAAALLETIGEALAAVPVDPA